MKKLIYLVLVVTLAGVLFNLYSRVSVVMSCAGDALNQPAQATLCIDALRSVHPSSETGLERALWENLAFVHKDARAVVHLNQEYTDSRYTALLDDCVHKYYTLCMMQVLTQPHVPSTVISAIAKYPDLPPVAMAQLSHVLAHRIKGDPAWCEKNNNVVLTVQKNKKLMYFLKTRRPLIHAKGTCFDALYLKGSLNLEFDPQYEDVFNLKVDQPVEIFAKEPFEKGPATSMKKWASMIRDFELFSYFNSSTIKANKIDLIADGDVVKAAAQEDTSPKSALKVIGHGSKYSMVSLASWQIADSLAKLKYSQSQARQGKALVIDLSACYVGKNISHGFARTLSQLLHQYDSLNGTDVYVIGADAPLWTFLNYNIPRPYSALKLFKYELPNLTKPGVFNVYKNGSLYKTVSTDDSFEDIYREAE